MPTADPVVTPELVKQHGLTPEEFERIKKILGREPNFTELGIFSVMWSEHCSYKNSKQELKKFPTTGPNILVKAGEENAGVVDIGDGWAIAFKMESHNHPSAIEPFQGAATGVGGIIRDIFTMGARPEFCLNSLRFGPITENCRCRCVGGEARDTPATTEDGRSRIAANRRLFTGGAGGRSVQGETFAGSMFGIARDRCRRRNSGHGRGGIDLLDLRNGEPRWQRRGNRSRESSEARTGNDAVRNFAERIAGTDVDHCETRQGKYCARNFREMGRALRRNRTCDRRRHDACAQQWQCVGGNSGEAVSGRGANLCTGSPEVDPGLCGRHGFTEGDNSVIRAIRG